MALVLTILAPGVTVLALVVTILAPKLMVLILIVLASVLTYWNWC